MGRRSGDRGNDDPLYRAVFGGERARVPTADGGRDERLAWFVQLPSAPPPSIPARPPVEIPPLPDDLPFQRRRFWIGAAVGATGGIIITEWSDAMVLGVLVLIAGIATLLWSFAPELRHQWGVERAARHIRDDLAVLRDPGWVHLRDFQHAAGSRAAIAVAPLETLLARRRAAITTARDRLAADLAGRPAEWHPTLAAPARTLTVVTAVRPDGRHRIDTDLTVPLVARRLEFASVGNVADDPAVPPAVRSVLTPRTRITHLLATDGGLVVDVVEHDLIDDRLEPVERRHVDWSTIVAGRTVIDGDAGRTMVFEVRDGPPVTVALVGSLAGHREPPDGTDAFIDEFRTRRRSPDR